MTTTPPCPRIQIAGVMSLAEAQMLADKGVDSIGFPLRLAVHPEDISEAEASRIIRALGARVTPVLITYLTDPAQISQFCDDLGATHIQLHADMPPSDLARLQAIRPDLYIIKSLIIRAQDQSAQADRLMERMRTQAPFVDAFLTDSFDPRTGATGATGLTHDWNVSRTLVRQCPRPIILAGGLTPDNVAAAIRAVRPAGVDAHTGVEDAHGLKDPQLVGSFVEQARRGFASLA